MISFTAYDVKIPRFKRRTVSKWIKIVGEKFNKRLGQIDFIYCSDIKILEINQKFLSHDYYTDVITFDYSSKEIISGDVFISLDTVSSNADKYNVQFQHELFRVMIHGILHLCGVNDKTNKMRQEMRKAENEMLNILSALKTVK